MRLPSFALAFFFAASAHAKPDWCKDGDFGKATAKDALAATEPRKAIDLLATIACVGSEDAATEKALAEARAKWGAKLGMTEPDWVDAAAFASSSSSDQGNKGISWRRSDKAPSTYSPVQQFSFIDDSSSEVIFKADTFANLTEAGRFGFIRKCMGKNSGPVLWAVCQRDIDTLDKKKLFEEIRSDKVASGFDKMILRFLVVESDEALKAHAANVAEWKAKDDAYAKMFTLVQDGYKAWEKVSADNVALATAMWDARITESRKAATGCQDKTQAALSAAVNEIPDSDLKGITSKNAQSAVPAALASFPNGYLAMFSYVLCVKAAEIERDPWYEDFGDLLERTPGYRGPRTAAQTAILNANLKLDKKGDSIEYFADAHETLKGSGVRNLPFGEGVVKEVKLKGNTATVVFMPQIYYVDNCVSEKLTNRIHSIDKNGRVYYHSICLKWAPEKHDSSSNPTEFDKRYLGGLTKGMEVRVGGGVEYARMKNAKKPAILFGAHLK